MDRDRHSVYSVEGFQIDTLRVCVTRDGEELPIRQKTFHVLVFLLANRERVVTKNELIDEIWPDTAVTDNTLEQCLGQIRKLLGDNPREPRFIKTVQRAGYRFIGDVTESLDGGLEAIATANVNAADGGTIRSRLVGRSGFVVGAIVLLIGGITYGWWSLLRQRDARDSAISTTLTQGPGRRAIAVMFFANESGRADIDWLREGLTDMMITDLSRSPNLAVLSREQLHVLLERFGSDSRNVGLEEAMKVAKSSHAQVLVMGSFMGLGDQIRIDVRLHDARDGQLLIADRIVAERPDQILTQTDLLSIKLASYLGSAGQHDTDAVLTTAMTNNLEAYRYYSLGVEKAQALQSKDAITLLKKAVALDPEFALAWGRIGYTYAVTGTSLSEGKPYLEKAFQLSARLTPKDRLHILAWYAIANTDYPAATKSYREIVAQYPLDVEAYGRLGTLLVGEERLDEAIEVYKQGLIMDPGAKDLYNRLGGLYTLAGRNDEAIAMQLHYVELAPDESNAHDSLAAAYQWSGRYDEAIAEYNRALELKSDFEIALVHLGNAYFQQGRYRDAIETYRRYVKLAPSDNERARGLICISEVQRRMGKLDEAGRIRGNTFRHSEMAAEEMVLISIDRNDLPSAEHFEATMEHLPFPARGARISERPLFYFRGLIDLKGGRAAKAIEDFKEALRRQPQPWRMDALEDCLANAYQELGELDQAVAEYQRIQTLNPNYALLHYHWARAYEKNGMSAEALDHYARFLEIWNQADADIPEIIGARRYVEQHSVKN